VDGVPDSRPGGALPVLEVLVVALAATRFLAASSRIKSPVASPAPVRRRQLREGEEEEEEKALHAREGGPEGVSLFFFLFLGRMPKLLDAGRDDLAPLPRRASIVMPPRQLAPRRGPVRNGLLFTG